MHFDAVPHREIYVLHFAVLHVGYMFGISFSVEACKVLPELILLRSKTTKQMGLLLFDCLFNTKDS